MNGWTVRIACPAPDSPRPNYTLSSVSRLTPPSKASSPRQCALRSARASCAISGRRRHQRPIHQDEVAASGTRFTDCQSCSSFFPAVLATMPLRGAGIHRVHDSIPASRIGSSTSRLAGVARRTLSRCVQASELHVPFAPRHGLVNKMYAAFGCRFPSLIATG